MPFRARSTSLKSHLLTNEPSNANKTMPAPEPTSSRNATRRRPAHFALTAILQFHAQSSICALADGLFAHRQRAHFHLQLALCAPQRRHDDPAHRRHRYRAQHRAVSATPFSTDWRGSASAGMNITGNPSASLCTNSSPTKFWRSGLAYRDFTPLDAGRNRESRTPAGHGFSIPAMREISARRKRPPRRGGRDVRGALPRAARYARSRHISRSRLRRAIENRRPTSRISRCCAATACRPIIWPPAPTMPICASATSSAGRII